MKGLPDIAKAALVLPVLYTVPRHPLDPNIRPFLVAVSIFGFDIFLALMGVGVMLAIKGLLIINKKMNNQLP